MNTKPIQIPGNDTQATEWANVTGRFFQAFGTIEFIVMEFIVKMASGFKFKSIKKKYLSQKLTWIIDSLGEHTDAPQEKIEEINDTLEEIRKLSFFRNVLAHGAIGYSEPGKDGREEPSILGLLNYRPDDTDQDAEIISLDELKCRLGETEDLARKLLDLLNGIRFSPIP
ncbi:MAG: hypothetical protein M3Y08_18915 [Fibrobacterota bacterium]|nr:hypothetical protein [Fibrobacterota bacterium]